MKYPQLVSTRAVNAISDWLVSRLEQLGVEAPLIYSRLLLSLLHSSVQINDPIEFNNLETYLASRKGNKRHHPCDTDTFKKLTAVKCLMDTVSSEQEIAQIENLVDELCEKLNDIEKQINSDEEEQHFQRIENILNSFAVGGGGAAAASNSATAIAHTSSKTSTLNSNASIKRASTNTTILTSSELEEDPRKRYYSAFPALSKDMDDNDAIRITNRNTKALTWPVGKSSSLQINNSIMKKNELCNNTAGVKRKPKRRRNQAMSKYRTNSNLGKSSYSGNCSPTWDTDFEGSWEMGRDLIKEFRVETCSRNRSTSESAAYNTFHSHDLAKNHEKRMKPMDSNEKHDFFVDFIPCSNKQSIQLNIQKNPFVVAGDGGCGDDDNCGANELKTTKTATIIAVMDEISSCANSSADGHDLVLDEIMFDEISSTTAAIQSNNLCEMTVNDEEECTNRNEYSSLSEVDLNHQNKKSHKRRLYERDISNDDDSSASFNLCSNIEQQQYDFAQFRAKFNSSVEALWNNNGTTVRVPTNSVHENQTSLNDLGSRVEPVKIVTRRLYERDMSNDEDSTTSSINYCTTMKTENLYDYAQFRAKFNSSVEALWKNNTDDTKNVHIEANLSSIPTSTGVNQNLENFWTNYYNHHYYGGNQFINDDLKDVALKKEYENEYFSMPQNFVVQNDHQMILKVPSGAVCLKDSIWSHSTKNYDDDDSFYASVLKSSNKNDTKIEHGSLNDDKDPNNFLINTSKWSEGINGVPSLETSIIPTQPSSMTLMEVSGSKCSIIDDTDYNRRDLRENMLKNSYFYNRHQQLQHQHQLEQQQFRHQQQQHIQQQKQELHQQRALNHHHHRNQQYQHHLRQQLQQQQQFQQQHLQQQQVQKQMVNTTFYNHSLSLSSDTGSVVSDRGAASKSFSLDEPFTDISNKAIEKLATFMPITLSNHSNRSSFIEYSRIKTQGTYPYILIEQDKFRSFPNVAETTSLFDSANSGYEIEEENLLTSDRTHFRPIKHVYADGYVFNISNNFDQVDFERSPNGYLHLDGNKYLEYTRSDVLATDDEHHTATNLFKSRKSSGAAASCLPDYKGKMMITEPRKIREEFILKFRIKSSNEKYCQTDPAISGQNSEYVLKMTKGHRRYHLNKINYHNQKYVEDYDDEYDEEDDDDSSDDVESMDSNSIYSKAVVTNIVPNEISKTENVNVLQSESININKQWSMHEIGKKCLDNIALNMLATAESDTNLNNKKSGSHTLWGLCETCNIIEAQGSIPASSLLKDELNLEADEIMSDLKYMQDLYIGGGNSRDWEDYGGDMDTDLNSEETSKDYECKENCMMMDNNNQNENSRINCNLDKENKDVIVEAQQKEMLYNVTKLITDFLKPENAKTLADALVNEALYAAANCEVTNKLQNRSKHSNNCSKNHEVNNNNNDKVDTYCGGLWNNDENSIWKQHENQSVDNVLLLNSNNNNNFTNNKNVIDDSTTTQESNDKLNWEFSNLAEIWNKNTTKSSSKELEQIHNSEHHNPSKKSTTISMDCDKTCPDESIRKETPQLLKNIENTSILNCSENEIVAELNNLQNEIKEAKQISDSIAKKEQQHHVHKSELKRIDGTIKTDEISHDRQLQILNRLHSQSFDSSTIHINNNKSNNNCKIQHQNRYDRKRRHSASQNVIVTTTTTTINDIIRSNLTGCYNNNIVAGGGQLSFINNNNHNNHNNMIYEINPIVHGSSFLDNFPNVQFLSAAGTKSNHLLNYEKFHTQIATMNNNNNNNNENNESIQKHCSSLPSSSSSATIITCKYWTTTLDGAPLILNSDGQQNTSHTTATFILDNENNTFAAATSSTAPCYKNVIVDSSSAAVENITGTAITINPSSILKHVALLTRPLTR